MKIDFSKFKKIECDDKCTTLQHESGHSLKIAHKSLSPDNKKELDALPIHLAKGGRAKFAQMYDPNMKGSKTAKPSASSNKMPGSPTDASQGFTEPDEMGTQIPRHEMQQDLQDKNYPDVVINALNKKAPPLGALSSDPKFHSPPCINPSCKSFGSSHPNCRCYGGKMGTHGGYAEGGKVEEEYFCDNNRPHFKACEYYKDGGGVSESDKLKQAEQDVASQDPENKMTSSQPSEPDPTAQGYGKETLPPPSPSPMPMQPQQQPTPPAPSAPQPQPESQPEPIDQNRAPAKAPEPPQDTFQTFQQHKQNAQNELFPEAQSFKQDLDNGHITPETYNSLFAKKDTVGKIGTLFGLMLSGMGSGLAHQPNMLMEMMNKQIENDLLAQQHSVENKQNFLKINQQNVLTQANAQNITAEAQTKAYALSRAQMNLAALHKLVTEAQKLPEGPQKQQAMQTLAIMNQGVQSENYDILDRAATAAALAKTLYNKSGGNTMMMKSGLLGPEAKEVGQDIESKTVPGYGVSQLPVPQDTKATLVNLDRFDQSLTHLKHLMKTHHGTIDWRKYPEADTAAKETAQAYQSVRGGIPSYSGAQELDSIITGGKDPLSFLSYLQGNPGRIDEIKKANEFQRGTLTKMAGLPEGSRSSPTQIELAKEWLKKNPNHKMAKEVREKLNGK